MLRSIPRMTMEESIAFGQRGTRCSAKAASEYARYLLARRPRTERFAHRYPHALSRRASVSVSTSPAPPGNEAAAGYPR